LGSFWVSFFEVFFRVLFGCSKGSQRVSKMVQNRSTRDPETASQRRSLKCSKNDDFHDPGMWLKCSKRLQNRWFWCLGFGPLLGLILEVFWEPKWRPRASKSGSQKSFKNMSKKWSIFDQFWGPFGVPNGARKVQIRAPKSDLASSRVLRGSRGRFGTYF